jgi:hypothetical protein
MLLAGPWRVLEIAAEPFRWARSLQLLDGEGLPVLEYPQSPGRMTPATARFYEAVVNGQLTQSGDSRLARHVGNAVLREDARGARLPRSGKTQHGGSTPRWPLSWRMTEPPPWPASPETASISRASCVLWSAPSARGEGSHEPVRYNVSAGRQ